MVCDKKYSITITVPFLVYTAKRLALKILRGKSSRTTITTFISIYCLPLTSSIFYKYFVLDFPISLIVLAWSIWYYHYKWQNKKLRYFILIIVNSTTKGFFNIPSCTNESGHQRENIHHLLFPPGSHNIKKDRFLRWMNRDRQSTHNVQVTFMF